MLQESPIFLARSVLQKFSDAYAAELQARFGTKRPEDVLTLPQYFLLRAIARFDKAPSQTDLIKATGIDRSTVSQVIRTLKNKKYITKVRSREDARCYTVRVAEEGAKVIATVKPIVELVEQSLLSHLSAKQRETLLEAMQALTFVDLDDGQHQQKRAA